MATTDSLAQQVLGAILDDPGVSASDIAEVLGVEGRRVSYTLGYLRRTGQVVNLGKHSRGASWYPTHKRRPDKR